MYTTPDKASRWEDINFKMAEQKVKKLQKRIAVAFGNDDFDKVALLQNMIIHSFYAKALAVKIVTSNRGRYTAGIDNVVWITPEEKFDAIYNLSRRGYKAMPLKRIFIPKSNGDMRPLSIPTMKDRAMQTLYKFVLEPIAEFTGDMDSYGFRLNRSAKDAVVRYIDILLNFPYLKWVMKTDIKSCFDNISHEWVMKHIPMDKEILLKFLKCGYMSHSVYHPTEKGVPQGGSISNVICNMVLDGLEICLDDHFGSSLYMIRYADDIVIVADSQKILVQSVVAVIEHFLLERGLQLSQEKTMVSHVENGIIFLGFEIYRENKVVVCVPARKSVTSLMSKVDCILSAVSKVYFDKIPDEILWKLCNSLKLVIRGWLNYYADIVTTQSLRDVKYELVSQVNKSTGDNRIAEFIKKLFKK
ncbi:group II intron reverse transcriptase/maturase [Faecalicatena orotica]